MSFVKLRTRTHSRRRRQGMTEYIIIVGLIGILMVPAVTVFRDSLADAFTASAEKLESDLDPEKKTTKKGVASPTFKPGPR